MARRRDIIPTVFQDALAARTVRGDSLLASVKRGGGGFRGPWYNGYRLATGAIVSEAVLRRVVLVRDGRLRPGPSAGEGALARLARQVEAEPKPQKLKEWLERTGPWAQQAIGTELEAAGIARLESRRFLGIFRHEPYLDIQDKAVQNDVFQLVREMLQGDRRPTAEAALLVVLLKSAAMLQYQVRTTRGRRMRRRFRELRDVLRDDVQTAVRAYESWDLAEPS